MKNLTLVFFLIAMQCITSFKDCNFTEFSFQNEYNLGQQDELNKTFTYLNYRFQIENVTYPYNSYTNYTIRNIQTKFTYLDSKQKAQIVGNNTIIIDGGKVQAVLDFQWVRKDFMEATGRGQAMCLSNEIIFAKNLTIQNGFLVYQVVDYYNVSFSSNPCKLLRYEPANTTAQDVDILTQMFNGLSKPQIPTVKIQLQQQIDRRYFYYLNNSLYNEKHRLDQTFWYYYQNPYTRKYVQTFYESLPTGVDLEKNGLSMSFVTQIANDPDWECGATIPHQPLDTRVYGGIQEFLSLSLFKNSLRYGISRGILDTYLNKDLWSSRMFQFFAGDLYEVIPQIATRYLANEPITGSCKGSNESVNILPQENINELKVRTHHNCTLYVQNNIKISQFSVDLFTHIEAKFQILGKVNFYAKNVEFGISYNEVFPYKIHDYTLANQLVKNSLQTIIGQKVYGSGWDIYKMDYPVFRIMDEGYIVFYDSSHIGQKQV